MSQTFPNDFKISNIDTGTESGTWGTITNANLNQIVRATGGFKQINVGSTNNHTVTAPADNTGNQDFRNHFLEFTGTSTGTAAAAFTLTLPAIEKEYVIKNSLQHSMDVKTSGQSDDLVTIGIGKTASVYLNGASALPTLNNIDDLTLNNPLPVSSGGTGLTSAEAGGVIIMNSAATAFTVVSAGTTGNVLTSDGDKFISASFQSAALTNVVRTNVGGYADAGNADPTPSNGGTQTMQGNLLIRDTTYDGFVAAGGLRVARNACGLTATTGTSLHQVNFHTVSSNEAGISTTFAVRHVSGSLRNTFTVVVEPITDDAIDLGGSSDRWRDIYTNGAVTTTSDRRKKNSIEDSDLGLTFINALQPRKFKKNEGGKTVDDSTVDENFIPTYTGKAGSRYHYGLIAQEVEQTLYNLNIDKSTFAGWCLADVADSTSTQSLRYEEFIAPMMKAIQELSNKVNILEARIQQLESE